MKTSNAMNVAVNLAVIGFVGLYLFHWIATRDGAKGSGKCLTKTATLCWSSRYFASCRCGHFRLFEQSDWHESQDWTKLAKEIGVDDIRQFSECLHSAATEARLEGDQALALEFGIRAVPTFVFRDATYTGQLNRWTLRDLVNRRQD